MWDFLNMGLNQMKINIRYIPAQSGLT